MKKILPSTQTTDRVLVFDEPAKMITLFQLISAASKAAGSVEGFCDTTLQNEIGNGQRISSVSPIPRLSGNQGCVVHNGENVDLFYPKNLVSATFTQRHGQSTVSFYDHTGTVRFSINLPAGATISDSDLEPFKPTGHGQTPGPTITTKHSPLPKGWRERFDALVFDNEHDLVVKATLQEGVPLQTALDTGHHGFETRYVPAASLQTVLSEAQQKGLYVVLFLLEPQTCQMSYPGRVTQVSEAKPGFTVKLEGRVLKDSQLFERVRNPLDTYPNHGTVESTVHFDIDSGRYTGAIVKFASVSKFGHQLYIIDQTTGHYVAQIVLSNDEGDPKAKDEWSSVLDAIQT